MLPFFLPLCSGWSFLVVEALIGEMFKSVRVMGLEDANVLWWVWFLCLSYDWLEVLLDERAVSSTISSLRSRLERISL